MTLNTLVFHSTMDRRSPLSGLPRSRGSAPPSGYLYRWLWSYYIPTSRKEWIAAPYVFLTYLSHPYLTRQQTLPIIVGPFNFITSDNSHSYTATYRLLRPFSSATRWQYSLPVLAFEYTFVCMQALNLAIAKFWESFPGLQPSNYISAEFRRFTRAIEIANRSGLDDLLVCAAQVCERVEVCSISMLCVVILIYLSVSSDFDLVESRAIPDGHGGNWCSL